MSPFACIRRHSSWVEARWSASVVRMKRSKEQFRRSPMARNFDAISSTNAFARFAFAGRRLLDLEAVLVGAGQEEHVVAVDALEARDRVRGDHLVGVADMRRPVRIGDRRRDDRTCLARPSGHPPEGRWTVSPFGGSRPQDRRRARSPPVVCRGCRARLRVRRGRPSHIPPREAQGAPRRRLRGLRGRFDTQAMAVSRASSRSPSVPRGETFSASRTTRFTSSRGSASRRALVSATMPDLSLSSSVERRAGPSLRQNRWRGSDRRPPCRRAAVRASR